MLKTLANWFYAFKRIPIKFFYVTYYALCVLKLEFLLSKILCKIVVICFYELMQIKLKF